MDSEEPKVGHFENVARVWQRILDKLSPLVLYRWIIFTIVMAGYITRVYLVNGWYIVTYGLGIYLLNQLIGFLSPQFDPDDENFDGLLPTKSSDEYRPFARRLPEFKFWYSCTQATVMAFFMTFFEVFDIPVFWPILLMYFFILFFMTMKRQISHMYKHRYIPFDFGKPKPGSAGGGSVSGGKDSK